MLMTKFDKYHLTLDDLPVHRRLVLKSDNLIIDGVFGVNTMRRCLYTYKLDSKGLPILDADEQEFLKEIVRPCNLRLFATDVNPPEILIEWDNTWIK